jgi:AraC-like DNA-binding protein
MKVQIKNMVTIHCKEAVKSELMKIGLHCNSLDLGEVDIMEELSVNELEELRVYLLFSGFELLENKTSVLTDKIKNVIIDLVHNSDEFIKIKISDYLSEKLKHDYTYLSNIFSAEVGTSIREFIILHKIERVKELLVYDELSISEIAWKLNYSSVAHLSNQFKKQTGFTPSQFKQLKDKSRIPYEEIGMPVVDFSVS